MPTNPTLFASRIGQVETARQQKATAFENLDAAKQRIAIAERELKYAQENGLPTAALQSTLNSYIAALAGYQAAYDQESLDESTAFQQFISSFNAQSTTVEELDDKIPILFFPVRIETVFKTVGNGRQLWVRIFPDDIAVDTHEPLLTQDEIDEGQNFWQSFYAGPTETDQIQAWDILSRSFRAQRAAWIALQTKPTQLSPSIAFPTLIPKSGSWTKQPVTNILPDAFVINCYKSAGYASPDYSVQTAPIPNEVKLGFDPMRNDTTFGDLEGSGTIQDLDVAWMVDFDAAVAKGLGAKINISNDDETFDRIIVVGVKTSITKDEGQARLQNLIDSHHYTDGFALLKQGTCTNNSPEGYAGYSAVEFGNKTTFATEQKGDLFTASANSASKTDGQFLCEALGIDFDPLYHIFQANGFDIRDAMGANSGLWQVAVGHYVTTLLVANDFATADINPLREFYTEFVRARGALPSIRSGRQPYGILPTSVFSRLQWSNDPKAGLYTKIHTHAEAVSAIWAAAAGTLSAEVSDALQTGNHADAVFNIVSRNAVSKDLVARIGVGAGLMWNTLVYSRQASGEEPMNPPFPALTTWYNAFHDKAQTLGSQLGVPLSKDSRISQISFTQEAKKITAPIVSAGDSQNGGRLPAMDGSAFNYLQIIGKAKFNELRDQNFAEYEVTAGATPPDDLLYRFCRQSVLLDYFEAAAKLLGSFEQLRVEPEFINIKVAGETASFESNNTYPLAYGTSRWAVMETPYGGFGRVADYLDNAREAGIVVPEAAQLFAAKDSIEGMGEIPVADLKLLVHETIDASSYRLDAWRLALVNQRLNALREITEGSSTRKKGIYLGAYGWVENVTRTPRDSASRPTSNFPVDTYLVDSDNQGYIHAPSLRQASAGAVLRSGYATRATPTTDSVLSVNISSERVRSGMDVIDGIRNGQNLSQLIGYEFERYLYENVTSSIPNPDTLVDQLRAKYPLQNPIAGYSSTVGTKNTQATNVLDGLKMLEAHRATLTNPPNTSNPNGAFYTAAGISPVPAAFSPLDALFSKSLAWIRNVIDSVGDLTTAESVYQIVGSNETRASSVADAISRGSYVPEIEHINTPKSGTGVHQRFTLHLEPNDATATGWDLTGSTLTHRANAEPYINRWLGQVLGNPALIQCGVSWDKFQTRDIISLADLKLQPLDLIYIANDEFINDASEMAIRIRRLVRQNNPAIDRTTHLEIDFTLDLSFSSTPPKPPKPTNVISFEEIAPVLRYLRDLVTASRALTTTDYVAPTDATSVVNDFDLIELRDRAVEARNALSDARDDLYSDKNAATVGNVLSIIALSEELFRISLFGFEQSIDEFTQDADDGDVVRLKTLAEALLAQADKRILSFDALFNLTTTVSTPITLGLPGADPDEWAKKYREGLQLIFGKAFITLPKFRLRASENAIFTSLLTSPPPPAPALGPQYGTLLKDQPIHERLVMDSWLAGISKVRKNASTYELLTLLAGSLNPGLFVTDRQIVPLQTPYATDGSERWLGAGFHTTTMPAGTTALKPGRVAFGVSLPIGGSLSGDQVGFMIDEWVDMIPNRSETTGIAFHANQPNAKAPQCLLLGLTPSITGSWKWNDIVDMVNETFNLAKSRAVSYDMISGTAIGQVLPAFAVSATVDPGSTIGISAIQ